MKALVIQQTHNDPPGRLAEILTRRGWELDVRLMENNDTVPEVLDGYRCLIVLGGPMNVDDFQGHPYLRLERNLVKKALLVDFPFLGICLGAQMLARAAGYSVFRNRGVEKGWYPVEATREGQADPILRGIPTRFEVFHWHDDMYELPLGASLLVTAETCSTQVVGLGKKAYGFQFHLEATEEIIVHWVNQYPEEIIAVHGASGPPEVIRQTAEKMAGYHEICTAIIENFLKIAAQS